MNRCLHFIDENGDCGAYPLEQPESGVVLSVDKLKIQMTWNINRASRTAIDRADDILSRQPSLPLSLDFSTSRWQMKEDFPDIQSGRLRVSEITRNFDTNIVGLRDYKLIEKPFPDGGDQTNIAKICRAWETTKGVVDSTFLELSDRADLLDRLIVLSINDEGHLIYRYIGIGHGKRFGASWPIDAIGTRYDIDQPDAPYTDWINEHYRRSLTDGPRRDILDTVIRCDDAPSSRVQYDRALLPSTFLGGAPALISVSEVRPGLAPLSP